MPFSKQEIEKHLSYPGLTIETYPSVTSTNTILKQRGSLGAPHGLVIAAESQSAGRGRMGRAFFSPSETGVYFSVLLRPNLSPADSLLITTSAAVACAQVLEQVSGKRAEIKWVNDIYVDGKKVCGMLTEASFAGGTTLDYAVLGIGINLFTPSGGFPAEIKEKAGSLLDSQNTDLRCYLIGEILNRFFPIYDQLPNRAFVDEYRSRSFLDGKQILVIKPDATVAATALYVDEDLSLLVRYPDGTTEHLSSGDISIRNI